MASKPLILISNPGSASRKYALFEGRRCLAELHFEYQNSKVVCGIHDHDSFRSVATGLKDVADAPGEIVKLLKQINVLGPGSTISALGLRIVAPSTYFTQDHLLTKDVVHKLLKLQELAPLHISASIQELKKLHKIYKKVPVYGISDSAFQATKPDYAQYYGLPLKDSQHLDIKRFGYHGLAVESAVSQLKVAAKLTPKIILVHLGSGTSVTALKNGRAVDNTMGYSPLDGLIMSSRSGSVDPTAARALQIAHGFNARKLDQYLNKFSGLVGMGGSADMRILLKREAIGNHRAQLALNTYVYNIIKAIGAASASLGGVDQLVFTGTIGQRSAAVRKHIVHRLTYLDFDLDNRLNMDCMDPLQPQLVSKSGKSKPIQVVSVDEAAIMARHVLGMIA